MIFHLPILLMTTCSLVGALVGAIFAKILIDRNLEKTHEKKSVIEKQKGELTEDLSDRLTRVRDGLIQSAIAYQDAIDVIDRKLRPSDDVMKRLGKKSRPLPRLELKVEAREDKNTKPIETKTVSSTVAVKSPDVSDKIAGRIEPQASSVESINETTTPPKEKVANVNGRVA